LIPAKIVKHKGRIVMKGFRRLTSTALLLAGMAGTVFAETDYFLVMEQKPGGGFAQAVAMAIVPLLDPADTVSIVGMSNTVTLLLPPMSLGTPGLLAMINNVLLKPIPQTLGRTSPRYSPAVAAAVNLTDEQAGALALAQPGRKARLVILAETTLKADGVPSPSTFARIDYISLNAAADPTLAGSDGIWALAEQPNPGAALPERLFAEGFLEFTKTINDTYTAAAISDDGGSFALGDFFHTAHNAAVIMMGAEAAVSKKGSGPGGETYQYGNYAAAAPGAGGAYTVAGAQVVFAAAAAPLKLWVIPTLATSALALAAGLVVFLLNGPAPAAFNIRIAKMDNRVYRDAENPVYIARVGWGSKKLGSGSTFRDVLNRIVVLNKNCGIQASAFEFLKDNKVVYNKEEKKWEITKARGAASSFPHVDVTSELTGTGSFAKSLVLPEKHGTHTYTIQFNRGRRNEGLQ
jgi:hypothetical protein